MGKLHKEVFTCIDCESTGLDPKNDRVIEIAAVHFTLDGVIDRFETLIDPLAPISPESTKIHHITDDMVKGQPTVSMIMPKLLDFVGKNIVVGHGIQFDLELLYYAAEHSGFTSYFRDLEFFDTLRLARLYGQSPINSLEELRKHFNIPNEGAHRAMSDVIVNIEVFKQLVRPYSSVGEIKKILSKPVRLKTMPLGKHKGRPMKEVPTVYLQWAANKDFDQDLLFSIRSELKRRKKGGLFTQASNPFQNL